MNFRYKPRRATRVALELADKLREVREFGLPPIRLSEEARHWLREHRRELHEEDEEPQSDEHD